MQKTLSMLAAALVAALSVGVAGAGATPVTPNGLCGASNMVNSNALPGMMNAMFGNGAGAGNAEMFAAVEHTACTP